MSMIDKLPYEWAVGIRYTRAGKRSARNSFISFISLISVAGIALGVAALIIVMSVMNGFQKDVTDRMLSVLAHIEIYDARGAMPNWPAVQQDAFHNPAVKGAAPFVETQGMLMYDGVMKPAVLRGILPAEEPKVSDVAQSIKQGSFDALRAGQFNIVLGIDLARSLNVKLGDKVTLAVASGENAEGAMTPRMVNFTLAGIFEAGYFEYDSTLAFVHMEDAMAITHLVAPAGIRLRIADMHKAPEVTQQLYRSMQGDLQMRDWTKNNATWFAAVQSQKKMMFVILILIIAVAAFNLVATLAMTVTDKQADIAILRTLGASPRSVMQIFVVQGALIGVIGTLIGVIGGVILAFNVDVVVPAVEQVLGFKFLSKDVYYISDLPSEVQVMDVASIGMMSLVLSFLATIYPSWRAARVNPAEALRYE